VRGGAGGDHVELSALSRALSSSSATRSQRIARLAAQYQAGQYQVDPAELGQSMVSDALEAPKL
jgi:anti-sigma28 factor (negative regulator of flagellin synthesis)